MFNNKRFSGEIDEVSMRDFLNKLDNKLGQKERIELIKDILYDENKLGVSHLNKYFEKVFEQKDMTENGDTSNIKLCLNKADGLSDSDYVCRGLESMADYLLFAPDGERISKKTKYNFYPKGIFENKIMKKDKNLEELVDSSNKSLTEGENSEDDVIDYLLRMGNNYKKSITQKIYAKDLVKSSVLRDYEEAILKSKDELSITIDNRKRKQLGNIIFGMKNDQLMTKDFENGTIYFKQALADTTCIEYEMLDFNNVDHVTALLKFPTLASYDFDNDLNCLIYDLQKLLDKINLTKEEKKVLEVWREPTMIQEDIAKEFGCSRQYVCKILINIAKKVSSQYNLEYEDFHFLNNEKGEYKKCSKCGEIKLTSKFTSKRDNKDKLENRCKLCEKERKSRKEI